MKTPIKIVFEEGCFDDFEGSQEELDSIVAELTKLAETGEIFDHSVPLDFEDAETLNLISRKDKRKVQ